MQRRARSRLIRRVAITTLSIAGCFLLAFLLMGVTNQQQANPDQPVLLFGIGVHIEPFGAQVSPIAIQAGARPRVLDPNQMDYN
ncbi:hypothetical protein KAJ02_02130, partial [Candidatus Bipolaricaulota bacterium]|nr:hypothetical protein [Candidatus Bipolaricaulota bacterium]